MITYILLIIIPLIVALWAQAKVSGTYKKYAKVQSRIGITGKETALRVMRAADIHDVKVVSIRGHLTDHYDPTSKQLVLSDENFAGTSLAALGVSAHEAGHAIQHAQGYKALQLRMSLIPVTKIATGLLPFVVFGGLLFGILGLIKLGVLVYLVLTMFQLVTLPVEFDASKRAKKALATLKIVDRSEARGVESTLNAAGLTYVAALVASLGNLLYLFLLSRR